MLARLLARFLTLAMLIAAPAALAQVVVPPPAVQAQAMQPKPVVAAPAVAAPAPSTISLADGYVIGIGDVIEVTVVGREEFHQRVQVQTDGTIQLLYLKTLPVINKTPLQLRQEIQSKLSAGGFYTDPVVNVSVVSFSARYVTVLGEVGTPGLLPVDRAYRVSEILAKVGGQRATGDDTIQLRRSSGENMTLQVQDVAAGGIDKDPFVNPGDKIYIATAPAFYIYGQVSAPGSYKVDHDMNLRKALARGGGLTERGSDKKIKLFRDGREMNGVSLSEPIKGGDTVVVGERFF